MTKNTSAIFKEIKSLEKKLDTNRVKADKLLKEIQDLNIRLQRNRYGSQYEHDGLITKLREAQYKYTDLRGESAEISREIVKLERIVNDY